MIGFELLDAVHSAGGARFELLVPADSPYFAGHFPGEPILPAVAQLALAEALATELLGVPAALAAIERIRFRAPIVPADRLTLELDGGGRAGDMAPAGFSPFALQLAVQRGGILVTAGRLSFAPRDSPWPAGPAFAARDPDPRSGPDGSRAPSHPRDPAVGALPHADPARLIERVLEHDEASSRCLARIPPASPFVRDDLQVPALLALEMGAQAAAAAESHARRHAGPGARPATLPRAGYLVGVRQARFGRAHLPRNEDHLVRTHLVRAAPPLRTWRIEVLLAGTPVASAEVSTFAVQAG